MSVRASKMHYLAIVFAVVLAGCTNDPRCPTLPGGPAYCLQTTGAVAPYTALQDIRIRRGDVDKRLIAQIEVDASGMHLAGLTPMGQRILDAHFNNLEATASSVAGDRLDARALLSIVQLAVWPIDSIRAGLDGSSHVEDTAELRRVFRDGTPIMEITRTGVPPHYQTLGITLPHANLSITIEAIKNDD